MGAESLLQRKEILVVEDDPVFRAILKEILSDTFADIDVLEAGDGEQALRVTEKHAPILVFMDIGLPDVNGLQLTGTLKSLHPTIAVVVVTNHDTPEYRAAADQSGADRFLSKNSSIASEIAAIVTATVPFLDRRKKSSRGPNEPQ
jgi:DNA-binding NarL/FixJ family response regulator